jgi:8-oxo-dGTP diphosphatase
MLFSEINWLDWEPTLHATLLFIIHDGQVMLIHKKTGLGVGKINGPGGKLEPNEKYKDCAIRETVEETCVTPYDVKYAGELRFQFTDGLSLYVAVFTAAGYMGELTETEEAKPFWCPVDQIPYDKMWEDDQHWVPHMLAGVRFTGRFLFDEHRLLGFNLASFPEI